MEALGVSIPQSGSPAPETERVHRGALPGMSRRGSTRLVPPGREQTGSMTPETVDTGTPPPAVCAHNGRNRHDFAEIRDVYAHNGPIRFEAGRGGIRANVGSGAKGW